MKQFLVEVWGDLAFTRRGQGRRMSYPVMTPSAARACWTASTVGTRPDGARG